MKYLNLFVAVFTFIVAIHKGIQGEFFYVTINAILGLLNLLCFVILHNRDKN